MQIEVIVRDKIARTANKHDFAVCGNSDYTIKFNFDSEWDAYEAKTARFKYNGTYTDVVFVDSECPMPIITNAFRVEIGVYAGGLHTTTSASLPLRKSILCGDEIEIESSLVGTNEIISAIEEANKEQAQIVNSGYDKILTAIDHAVFDKQLLVDILAGTCENLTGDAITKIADYVFYKKTSLKTIDLPNCVSIGDYAFAGCKSLTNIYTPNCISVGDYAFDDCEKLTEINLPLLTSFGGCAFYNCDELTKVYFPLVTSCSDYGRDFYGCTSLTEVYMPLLTSVSYNTFYRCESLTEVDFPLLTYLGGSAFDNCTSLTKADFPLLTSIINKAFYNCKKLTEVNFPLVTSIDQYTFYGCESLTEVNFPLVTYLGSSAFQKCTGLTELYFPLLTSIGNYAFMGCTGLRKIFIPASCVKISGYTTATSPFRDCSAKLEIFCEATEKPSGWEEYWNYYGKGAGGYNLYLNVHWGATLEEYEAY